MSTTVCVYVCRDCGEPAGRGDELMRPHSPGVLAVRCSGSGHSPARVEVRAELAAVFDPVARAQKQLRAAERLRSTLVEKASLAGARARNTTATARRRAASEKRLVEIARQLEGLDLLIANTRRELEELAEAKPCPAP